MSYLLDTNILLRYIVANHPLNEHTVEATEQLKASNEKLFITSQNLIEFWNVATRPEQRNGLGLTLDRTKDKIKLLKKIFILLPDTPSVYLTWEQLVTNYQVKGVNVYDTRLVAFMLVHKISHILTFNTKDFQRFHSEIIVVHPDTVMND